MQRPLQTNYQICFIDILLYQPTVQPAWNLHKLSDPSGQNYPRAVEHRGRTPVDPGGHDPRDDRTRGFALVAREGSSRSTVFHRLHCKYKLYKISD